MSYAFFYDVPANEGMYRRIKAALGDEQPPGLVVQLVVETDGGLRHIDVWESSEHWERFRDERAEPAVRSVLAAAGFAEMPPDPPVHELALVDVWFGRGMSE